MQNFVVLAIALFVPSALAGTRQAHPGEEARALALFDKLCSGGRDGGIEGGIFVHCKHAIQPLTYHLAETIRGDLNAPKQVEQFIFVSPPALHYNHALRIQGSGGREPKTTVYVQPVKSTHSYDANINVDETGHVKPELVFLSGSSGGDTGFKAGGGHGFNGAGANADASASANAGAGAGGFGGGRGRARASASASASASAGSQG